MSMVRARAAVAQGIVFLDSRPDIVGDWRSLINLDSLDIDDVYRCVLGQIGVARGIGGYTPTADALGLPLGDGTTTAYGFCPEGYGGFNSDEITPWELTIAWQEALAPATTPA